MSRRNDSEGTRKAIEESAAELFARKGFRGATIREICTHAHANIALVSRYFGSKEKLYISVCRKLFQSQVSSIACLADGIQNGEEWRAAIHEWIQTFLEVATSGVPSSRHLAQIFRNEVTMPTPGVHQYLKSEFADPLLASLRRLVTMALPDGSEAQICIWLSAIWLHSSVYAMADDRWLQNFRPADVSIKRWMETVCDKLTSFIFASLEFKERR